MTKASQHNFVRGGLTLALIVASTLTFGACNRRAPTDALDAAQNAVYGAIRARGCADAEYAEAERLLAAAQAAMDAGEYDDARDLAEQAQVQAAHAERVHLQNFPCDEVDPLAGATDDQGPNGPQERTSSLASGYEFTTVYFEFDSWTLNAEAQSVLESHARVLQSDPDVRIRVSGHCSEEGTPAYNLALGERRARAVKQYLVRMGVGSDRIGVISFGEEVPGGGGPSDRRAEFEVR